MSCVAHLLKKKKRAHTILWSDHIFTKRSLIKTKLRGGGEEGRTKCGRMGGTSDRIPNDAASA